MNIEVLSTIDSRSMTLLSDCIKDAENSVDLEYVIEWWQNKKKWAMPRVSIDTFLDSPMYLGIGRYVYPEIRKMARDIVNSRYSEAVVVAGIGSGKSFLSEILACYSAHMLLCMHEPHRNYGLVDDKPITIMNMGITATQATDVVFSGICSLIQKSPWFKAFNPRVLGGSIYFSRNKVYMVPGNSKSTTPLGYNLFCGILDEAAFYLDTDAHNVAEEIYTAMQRRIVSRFGYDGLVIMISSPRYIDDFIMRKLEDSIKYSKRIYGRQIPTWKCKPPHKADLKNRFYFNVRKGLIEDKIPENFGIVNKIIDKYDPAAEIWEIPGEYKMSFQQNPDKARRDFGSVPSLTLQGFFPHTHMVEAVFNADRPPPYDYHNKISLPEALRVPYYIHIDLALNVNGKGDAAGFCMAHFDGFAKNEIGEKKKKVFVDLLMRITAGKGGEISFEEIRNLIYAIKDKGYYVKKVTLDGFQSADFMQILNRKGIRADYLSVDRTIEPYNTLKELIYDKRVDIHMMKKAIEELCRLEVVRGIKIDHPPSGSKDCADALCGAVYNVIVEETGEMGVASGSYYEMKQNNIMDQLKEEKPGATAEKRKTRQELYYEELENMRTKGMI